MILMGYLAFLDPPKESAANAIKALKEHGVRTKILTGDNEKTASHIAKKVGITHLKYELKPSDKQEFIQKLQQQGKIVAMVGDGINDAPALLVSDIGIAVGSGVDIALKTCDVILMKNDLNDIDKLIKMSRYTMLNIKENLFWGFIYNLFGVIIATGVTSIRITPMMASIFMMLSSISVLTNAIRLKYKKI